VVKVILQIYPVIPGTREERKTLRPIGRNVERYQQVLAGWHDVIKAADRLGVWGVSTIEHHFHSEGYEVGPTPGVMNAYWAAITERVHIGQLGYVMSAQNPIRVAEEVAILDHLTRGRCFVGFARGYQARWTNILGQHLGARATLSPRGADAEVLSGLTEAERSRRFSDDDVNRAIFEENIDLTMRAWTQDSITANGRWQIPYPIDEGVPWTMTATRDFGAEGEMDVDGRIKRISVVPAPYTKPHPPVFVSSNASRETIEYCAPRGFIPAYFSPISRASDYGRAYVDAAADVGSSYQLGENQALVRWLQLGSTTAEARQAVERYDVDIFRDLYAATTPMTLSAHDLVESVIASGLWLVGTPTEVRAQLLDQWRQLPAEYLVLIFHYAQQPAKSVIENIEIFMREIKPALEQA
jgi:alkanesulfonate monooxygenase SsuD/methylene tetrahydromethanopterin reductase-like flavin-dependent oxidoreductase (luciferase family)